jgi:hypothetical protein
MICLVLPTHENGRRLGKDETATREPVKSDLILYDWATGSRYARAIRIAELHGLDSYSPDVLKPLADPVLVKVTGRGFLLVGVEIETTSQDVSLEHAQGWWCQPVFGTPRSLPAIFDAVGKRLEFDSSGHLKK